MSLNNREIAVIKGMLARGDKQHDIAAFFGVNGGRVAEVKTGSNGTGIEVANENDLPPAGPGMSGRSALHARESLKAVRDLIDEVLADIDVFERRGE